MIKNTYKLVTKIRNVIYDYVYEKFGESEANNPSWYIPTLAEEIADKLLDDNYIPLHTYHNDEEEEVTDDDKRVCDRWCNND